MEHVTILLAPISVLASMVITLIDQPGRVEVSTVSSAIKPWLRLSFISAALYICYDGSLVKMWYKVSSMLVTCAKLNSTRTSGCSYDTGLIFCLLWRQLMNQIRSFLPSRNPRQCSKFKNGWTNVAFLPRKLAKTNFPIIENPSLWTQKSTCSGEKRCRKLKERSQIVRQTRTTVL